MQLLEMVWGVSKASLCHTRVRPSLTPELMLGLLSPGQLWVEEDKGPWSPVSGRRGRLRRPHPKLGALVAFLSSPTLASFVLSPHVPQDTRPPSQLSCEHHGWDTAALLWVLCFVMCVLTLLWDPGLPGGANY